jgi:iron complex transport system ATP-binding protein
MSLSLIADRVGVSIGGRVLLADVSLRVGPGEVVALVGPNGAGKSTLLKVLAGDLAPNVGRVLLDERPLSAFRPRELALRRAVLPQQTVIQFAFTAREIVTMGRGPRRGHDDEVVVARTLAQTESLPIAERHYPSLSGGEQARVSLARVLAQEAPLLLLDEPTSALDPRHQQMVMDLARDVAASGGAVVAILHDLNLAASAADRIVLLHEGRVVADGAPWATLTETLLSDVFACPIAVTAHPLRDCPLILPLLRSVAAEAQY